MRSLINVFSSLKLTLILLTSAFLLIFFATLNQVDQGIYETQKRYFQSLFVVWQYDPYALGASYLKWIRVPLLGGYTLGGLLLVNLITAHVRYFSFQWKQLGISLIHIGVSLLLVAGFVSSTYQEESQMTIRPNIATYYSESFRANELVIIDITDSIVDHVVSIPVDQVKPDQQISTQYLPFTIQMDTLMLNSQVRKLKDLPKSYVTKATHGIAKEHNLEAVSIPMNYKNDEIPTVSAYITLRDTESILGTWLVSNVLDTNFKPQIFEYNNRTYTLALRFKRMYNPYGLELVTFEHNVYPGTEVPKSFLSKVKIVQDLTQDTLEAKIYMNNPLRYQGKTFYQASYLEGGTASVLQVVRNPGWLLPYICILIIALGMVLHFFVKLSKSLHKHF